MKDDMFVKGITLEKIEKIFFFETNKDLDLNDGSSIKAGTGFIIDPVEKQNINIRFEINESNTYTNEENLYKFNLDELKDFGEPCIDSIELKNLEGIIHTEYYIDNIINMNVDKLANELKGCLIQDAGTDIYKYEEIYDFIEKTYGENSLVKLANEYIDAAKEAKEINEGVFVGISEYINYKVEDKERDRITEKKCISIDGGHKDSIKDKIESIKIKSISKNLFSTKENDKAKSKKLNNSQQSR